MDDFMSDKFILNATPQLSFEEIKTSKEKEQGVIGDLRKELKRAKKNRNWKECSIIKKKMKKLKKSRKRSKIEGNLQNRLKSGVGFEMMEKMGYRDGKRIGKGKNGLLDPIKLDLRRRNNHVKTFGVGSFSELDNDNYQYVEEITQEDVNVVKYRTDMIKRIKQKNINRQIRNTQNFLGIREKNLDHPISLVLTFESDDESDLQFFE